jgi:hypothetical protein
MKKILLAIAMIAMIPTAAMAYITPGVNGSDPCTYVAEARSVCARSADAEKRIYSLEVLVNQLQTQIAAQPAAAAPAQVAPQPQDTSRIAALEARVSILEKTMDIMTGSVMKVLQQVITFLQKGG